MEALHEHRPTAASKAADDDAVRELLRDRAGEFAKLLTGLGPDRDLADKADPLVHDDWPGWRLMTELRSIRGVGVTIGTKLLARKRPRLRPIWDDIVAELIQAPRMWEPLRPHLRADQCALHHRLLRLRRDAGLPEKISAK
ncbi:MAG TPA: hypothetical protein DGT23_16075 [Micromonosporaceae bacterium]|nr:hypothetical protein [Micromonosporaceae bacterium]